MSASRYSITEPVAVNPMGRRGMISTPHYLASQAGLAILRRGGTAVDAVIAATAVLSVVYPHMCGLGGDSFWLIYEAASGQLRALNASGRAAALADTAFYTNRGFTSVPMRGPLAANTVPGAVSGWGAAYELSKKSMSSPLSWAELLDDACCYAEEGFATAPSLSYWLRVNIGGETPQRALEKLPGFLQLFCTDDTGNIPAAGQWLRQPELARSLQLLSRNGIAEFYEGSIAQAVDRSMQALGGPLRAADFAAHRADWADALSVSYRGFTAVSAPPNCQGISALQILNICNYLDIGAMGEGSADYYHHLVEAVRLAFADRNRWLTDPDHVNIPLHELLSSAYGREQAGRIRSEQSLSVLQPLEPGGDTVWVGAVDSAGNAVSMLQSIYHEFGSGIAAKDTGILLQNRGCAFSLDPVHVNCLKPGKRSMHTLTPVMLLEKGKPWLVYGSMGGDGQPQTVAALTTRMADFNLSPQEAVTAPRWLLGRSWGAPDNDLKLEGRISSSIAEDLRRRGHVVRMLDNFTEVMGHAGAIRCHANGILQGAADPRSDGQALAF
ncbi:MAG: gamma-glutamyltransferase [Desulfovibrio sp.]|nr:gamma-glutamyltransferase [Desulfovibrio sp.]